MKLLFLKTETSKIPFVLERQMIKTGLLIGTEYNHYATTLRGLVVYHNSALASDSQTIQNYKYYYTQLGNGYTEEELDQFLYTLQFVKNKKFKSRDELIAMGRMEKNLKKIKEDLGLASVHWLKENYLDSIINFYTDDILLIYDESAEKVVNQSFYAEMVLEEILEPEMISIFAKQKDKKDKNIEPHEPLTAASLDGVFSSTLFQIPCLDSLSYNQLRIIRNEFQEVIIPFHTAIEEMRIKFSGYNLNEDTMVAIEEEFDLLVEPHAKFLADLIADNIYIQQIKNSAENPKIYQLSISYSSIKVFLKLHENSATINEIEKNNIIEKIGLIKDVNDLIVFFHLNEIATE